MFFCAASKLKTKTGVWFHVPGFKFQDFQNPETGTNLFPSVINKSPMKPKTALILLAVLTMFTPVPAGAADKQTSLLIDRVLAAYGSWDSLGRVRSYRMEGTVVAKMRNIQGPAVRTFARPDRLKVDLQYPGAPEGRILNRTQGWRSDKTGNLQPVTGFLFESMRLQAARANIPWILDDMKEQARPTVPVIVDGTQYAGIEMTLGPGVIFRVYAHPETHLIIHSQGVLDLPGMKTGFVASYSDFRKMAGVLFPYREENYASGYHTGSTIIEKITVNPELPVGYFKPSLN